MISMASQDTVTANHGPWAQYILGEGGWRKQHMWKMDWNLLWQGGKKKSLLTAVIFRLLATLLSPVLGWKMTSVRTGVES